MTYNVTRLLPLEAIFFLATGVISFNSNFDIHIYQCLRRSNMTKTRLCHDCIPEQPRTLMDGVVSVLYRIASLSPVVRSDRNSERNEGG